MINVQLDHGDAVRVTLANTDGEFTLSFGAPHLSADLLTIHTSTPDDSNRTGVIYSSVLRTDYIHMQSSPTGRVSRSEPDIQNFPGTLAAALEMQFAKHGTPDAARIMTGVADPARSAPDYKAIAEELFDMLTGAHDMLRKSTDSESTACSVECAALLDNVEAAVKGK